jgi:hypothetical protein
MLLEAFKDELVRTRPAGLVKTARILAGPPPDRLIQRLIATGALSSGALHGAQAAKAGLTGDYGPEGTMGRAAGRGAVGGLIAALGLKALGRLSKKGRIR